MKYPTKPKHLVKDPSLLHKLLKHDPDTGTLFWRSRPLEMFKRERHWKMWNKRYAGKEAFASTTGDGYRQGSIFNKMFKAHRVIWAMEYGAWPEDQIDHINGDKTDNRLFNLRDVTSRENSQNVKRRSDNTSGVVGVYWDRNRGKWLAQIRFDGKQKHLGYFDTLDEAREMRAFAEELCDYHPNHGREEAVA